MKKSVAWSVFGVCVCVCLHVSQPLSLSLDLSTSLSLSLDLSLSTSLSLVLSLSLKTSLSFSTHNLCRHEELRRFVRANHVCKPYATTPSWNKPSPRVHKAHFCCLLICNLKVCHLPLVA